MITANTQFKPVQMGSIREVSLRICNQQHDRHVHAARNMLKHTSAGNTTIHGHGRDLRDVTWMDCITFACKRQDLPALTPRLERRDQKPTTSVVGGSLAEQCTLECIAQRTRFNNMDIVRPGLPFAQAFGHNRCLETQLGSFAQTSRHLADHTQLA